MYFLCTDIACGPVKKGGSVLQVVVAGGMTTTGGTEDPTSIVEIYDTKGNTWTAGILRFTVKI